MKPDRHLAAQLLSHKRELSVIEKEEILEEVLDRVAARKRPAWTWLAVATCAAAAGIAGLVVAVSQRTLDSGFAVRGGPASVDVELACQDRAACRQGDLLLFRIHGTSPSSYFSAFARREDGTVIWYFPGAGAKASIALGESSQGVLGRGVRLGPEHVPGRYEVIGLVSPQPLSKEQVRALVEGHDATLGREVLIIRRTLVVEAGA